MPYDKNLVIILENLAHHILNDGWDFYISFPDDSDLLGIFRLTERKRFTQKIPTRQITVGDLQLGLGMFQVKEPRNKILRAEWEFNELSRDDRYDHLEDREIKELVMHGFSLTSEKPFLGGPQSEEYRYPTIKAIIDFSYSFKRIGEAPSHEIKLCAQLKFRFSAEKEDFVDSNNLLRPELTIFDARQTEGSKDALSAYVGRIDKEALVGSSSVSNDRITFG